MKLKCLVLYARDYRIKNDDGITNSGVTFSYIITSDLLPTGNMQEGFGFKPCRDSLPLSNSNDFLNCPGFYDIEFSMLPGANGKPSLRVTSVEYTGLVNAKEEPYKSPNVIVSGSKKDIIK